MTYNKEWARLYRARNAEKIKVFTASPKGRYHAHRMNAKKRGIPWEFTFDSWWEMWSPHWEKRGKGKSKLVMARKGDKGPYSPSNVDIKSGAENSREGQYFCTPKKLPIDAIHAIRGTNPKIASNALARFWGTSSMVVDGIRSRKFYSWVPEEQDMPFYTTHGRRDYRCSE